MLNIEYTTCKNCQLKTPAKAIRCVHCHQHPDVHLIYVPKKVKPPVPPLRYVQ